MAQVSFATIKKGVPKRKIVLSTFSHFLNNELPTSAAAISYFAMLGLFPLLLLLFTLSQQYPGLRDVNLQAIETVLNLLPTSKEVVHSNLEKFVKLSQAEMFTCLIIVLWAASWALSIIERAINRIWRTSPRSFLHGRLLSLGMMAVIGALLAVSAVAAGLFTVLQSETARLSHQMTSAAVMMNGYLWPVLFGVAGFMMTVVLFLLVYKIMPNTRVTIIEALPGAVLAGIAWETAKYLFAWSLTNVPYDQLYGSIAAVVATLTWTYISSLIMLFGAQMTALLHCDHLMEEKAPTPQVVRAAAGASGRLS
jgi:membrane protein